MKAVDFAVGLVEAAVLVIAFLGLLQCAGCATTTDEETWTRAEVQEIVKKAAALGYLKGWTDATVQAGKDL